MITCPKCGTALDDGSQFCASCGASLVAEATPLQAAPAKPKKNLKKILLLAGIGIAVVAVIVIALMFLLGGAKEPNVAMYLKDGEIWFSDFSKEGTFELSDKLADSDLVKDGLKNRGYQIFFNKDCSLVFYPDRIDSNGDFTLYCKEVGKKDAEAKKIDSGLSGYYISEKGDKVLFEKDDILYIYDVKEEERTKIANEFEGVKALSLDLTKVIYSTTTETTVTDENGVESKEVSYNLHYWSEKDDESTKIVSDYESIEYVDEDLKIVYYTKNQGTKEKPDNTLYKQIVGKDEKTKIENEVVSVSIYSEEEVYFTKLVEGTEQELEKYLTDDMLESDAAMESPYDKEFTTDAERDEYYEKWNNKQSRDYLREIAKTQKIKINTYDLYFYNGKDDTKVAGDVTGIKDYATDKPVLVIETLTGNKKIKMSELKESFSSYELERMLREGEASLVIGKSEFDLEQKNGERYLLSDDGSVLYILGQLHEENYTCDLYKVTIKKDKIDKQEAYANEVYRYGVSLIWDTSIRYFKDCKGKDITNEDGTKSVDYSDCETGSLYVDKKELDDNITIDGSFSSNTDTKTLIYAVDYDSEKKTYTLKQYVQGEKTTTIADDVYSYSVMPNGEILYLTDYNLEKSRGELVHWADGKRTSVDEDVTKLITPYYFTESIEQMYAGSWTYLYIY